MKTTGLIVEQKSDEQGRIELPRQIRQLMSLEPGDSVELCGTSDGTVLMMRRKAFCFNCKSMEHLKQFRSGRHICAECLAEPE